jgi:cysteine desulfurase / selenocysteine lyase
LMLAGVGAHRFLCFGDASGCRGLCYLCRVSGVSPYARDFGPFDGRVWLNAAHQGPLPRSALAALAEAAELKRAPHRIVDGAFLEVPQRLRQALGRLLDLPAAEIVVGNSASYGLQLFVDGLEWRRGDEVLVVAGDFPASITPWFVLENRGVSVRLLEPAGPVVTADEVAQAIGVRTRLLCTSWVNSFNGAVLDVASVGSVCRDRSVLFLLNATQGIGARPIRPAELPLDALTCSGFKWLCGPYGTGFAWLRPQVRETLIRSQTYWLALPDDVELEEALGSPPRVRADLGARAYDVFGTASFFNLIPWTAAIEYLTEIGIEQIAEHDDLLVQRLVEGLDPERFLLLSPASRAERSTIAVFSDRDQNRNARIHATLTKAGIDTALRNGAIRISAHLYNGTDELDQALALAAEARPRGRRPTHGRRR